MIRAASKSIRKTASKRMHRMVPTSGKRFKAVDAKDLRESGDAQQQQKVKTSKLA